MGLYSVEYSPLGGSLKGFVPCCYHLRADPSSMHLHMSFAHASYFASADWRRGQ